MATACRFPQAAPGWRQECLTAGPLAAVPLVQLCRRYCAEWQGVGFSIHNDSDGWIVEVRDAVKGEMLYVGRRVGANAARAAAVEFAIFYVSGGISIPPERLAAELRWTERW
jgi:hypothetical protein